MQNVVPNPIPAHHKSIFYPSFPAWLPKECFSFWLTQPRSNSLQCILWKISLTCPAPVVPKGPVSQSLVPATDFHSQKESQGCPLGKIYPSHFSGQTLGGKRNREISGSQFFQRDKQTSKQYSHFPRRSHNRILS